MQAKTWKNLLEKEKQAPYFQDTLRFVKQRRQAGVVVYPKAADVFNAFKYTPFPPKVVILGQDPYHQPGQAHGLCFSVAPGVSPPPSLKNIFREIQNNFDIPMPTHGCLDKWAKQGVLLLNTVLTVEDSKPLSHANLGWPTFTDRVISLLNEACDHLVFLLWGNQAKKKAEKIDPMKHFILTASHPSPLSAHQGFLGCRHFAKTNAWLTKHHREPIDWAI